jgi:hypothetical protein
MEMGLMTFVVQFEDDQTMSVPMMVVKHFTGFEGDVLGLMRFNC